MSEPPPPPPPTGIGFKDPVCGVSVEIPEGWAPGSLKGIVLNVSTPSDIVTGYGACVLGLTPQQAIKFFLRLFPGNVSVKVTRQSPNAVEVGFRTTIPGTRIIVEGVAHAEAYEAGSLLRYATGSADIPEVNPSMPSPAKKAVLRSPHGEDALAVIVPREWVVRGELVADGIAAYEVRSSGAVVRYLGESQGMGEPPDPLRFAGERLGIGENPMTFPAGLPPVASISFIRALGASMVGGTWGYRSYLVGSGGRWAWVYTIHYAVPMLPPVWHIGAYVAEGEDALNTLLSAAAHTYWAEAYLRALGKREAAASRAAYASFRRSIATSRAITASFRRSASSSTLSYGPGYSSYSGYDDTGYGGDDWSSGSDEDSEFMGVAKELGRDWDEIGEGGFSDYDMDSGNTEFFIDSDGQVRTYGYGEEVVGAEIDGVGNILDEEGNVIGRIEDGYVYDAEGNRVGYVNTEKSDEWAMELYEQNIPGAEWVFGENEFGPEREEGPDPYHVSRLYSRDEKDE